MNPDKPYSSVWMMLFYRMLIGIFFGSMSVVCLLTVGIIADGDASILFDPDLRSGLVTALVLSLAVGGLVGFVWGTYIWLSSLKKSGWMLLLWRALVGAGLGSIVLVCILAVKFSVVGMNLKRRLLHESEGQAELITAIGLSWLIGGLVGFASGLYTWLTSKNEMEKSDKITN